MNPATLIFELPDASGDSRKMAHHDNYPLTVQVYRYHDYTVQTYKCVSTEFGQPAMGLNNFELLRNSATLGLKLNILQLLSLTLSEKLNVLQQSGQTSSTFCTQCNKGLYFNDVTFLGVFQTPTPLCHQESPFSGTPSPLSSHKR